MFRATLIAGTLVLIYVFMHFVAGSPSASNMHDIDTDNAQR
jgi:hypothetical protein